MSTVSESGNVRQILVSVGCVYVLDVLLLFVEVNKKLPFVAKG